MSDLISRYEAIKAIRKCKFESVMPMYWYIGMEAAQDIVDKVPSAEAVQGKWETAYLDNEAMGERPSVIYCSRCNHCFAYKTNFCPNCGARMKGCDSE